MTAQDLSSRELRICALLYSTENSILFDLGVLVRMNNELFASITGGMRWVEDNTFKGTWFRRPFCTTHYDTILRLQSQRLIRRCKEYDEVFYVLDIRKEHEEFFKELKVQIAIGSL